MHVSRLAGLSGAVMMLLAVVVGAFGSHALEPVLRANQRVEVFSIASNYHFYHALGLLLIAVLSDLKPQLKYKFAICVLLNIGIVLFSGSLYLLAITDITYFGAITPLGGVCFLIAWCLLALSFIHQTNNAD